nr:PREDICTED: long-chain-fatty-acid--CoA ligase ACSBG2-like [Latimeria chalumnae]|eukprot:XP_014345329.1 PREDICTED: long-chain-fatty-acid--CoA ligase ACSBG2-like [Latimeria chalumnae]
MDLCPCPCSCLFFSAGDVTPVEAVPITSMPEGECDLAPATHLWTTMKDGAVRLRMDPSGAGSLPPKTVHQMFVETVKSNGNLAALGVKEEGRWQTISYKEYYEKCRRAAKGFLKLGLERYHGVGILGFNSAEWVIADIGAIMAGMTLQGSARLPLEQQEMLMKEASFLQLTWVAYAAGKMVKIGAGESIVSYLPLSHIAAQMLDVWTPIQYSNTTYFADPDALKGSLVVTLQEVRPTVFLGVPRVWEKMQEKMKAVSAKASVVKRKVASWAKGVGLQANYNIMNGSSSMPWGYTLANNLVFKKVQQGLGLDRCSCYTGAAPITKDTLEFFLSLNIPLYELYGMSESTGPHTTSMEGSFRIMSNLFQLVIELIITAGGENIPPVLIEDALKEQLPIISNAMLIGDKRKFLSVLLTLKCEMDEESGASLDELSSVAIQFCQQVGSSATRVSEIVNSRDQAIYKAIQEGIDKVNERATSNAQKIQKWTLLERDFTIVGGELGPTMKLKRPVVVKMYQDEIEKLYAV